MTFQDAQAAAYNLTELEYKRLSKEILVSYQRAYDDITDRMRRVYADILDGVPKSEYYATMVKFKRYEKLMEEIGKTYRVAAVRAGKTQAEASRIAISNAYYRQYYVVNWVDTKAIPILLSPDVIEVSVLGTPKVWASIKKDALEKINSTWGSLANYQPKYGTLTQVLVKNNQQALARIRGTITQGLITGDSNRKIAKQLQKDFDTTANNAFRIARTEGHRNIMAGNYAMTNAARTEGVEVRRQIISTLDLRTRKQSGEVDQRKEDKEGLFEYPDGVKVAIPGNSGRKEWDINDRESVINNVNDVSPELRRARDPVTGETDIIGFDSFDKWMKDNDLKWSKSGQIVPKKN